jgi:hypothetical protein
MLRGRHQWGFATQSSRKQSCAPHDGRTASCQLLSSFTFAYPWGSPAHEHLTSKKARRVERIDLAGRQHSLFALIIALLIFYGFGIEGLGRRLWTTVDGVVIAAEDIPAKGKPRYATIYVIQAPDGSKRSYTAGATDGSLPRSMPVGTRLTKQRWQLWYIRDEQVTDDFPLTLYSGMLGLGIAFLVWGVILWRAGPGATASLSK